MPCHEASGVRSSGRRVLFPLTQPVLHSVIDVERRAAIAPPTSLQPFRSVDAYRPLGGKVTSVGNRDRRRASSVGHDAPQSGWVPDRQDVRRVGRSNLVDPDTDPTIVAYVGVGHRPRERRRVWPIRDRRISPVRRVHRGGRRAQRPSARTPRGRRHAGRPAQSASQRAQAREHGASTSARAAAGRAQPATPAGTSTGPQSKRSPRAPCGTLGSNGSRAAWARHGVVRTNAPHPPYSPTRYDAHRTGEARDRRATAGIRYALTARARTRVRPTTSRPFWRRSMIERGRCGPVAHRR